MMNIEAGNEKRVFEFISNLKDTDKIALLSHTDLDGIVSAIVTNKVIDSDIVDFLNYTDLNPETVKNLKRKGVNKIIFTDLYFKSTEFLKELENFAEILVIDHHPFITDWNSERTVFIKGEDGYSCSYLCYYLFTKIIGLEKIDWLVACSCISDFCHKKPEKWLRKIMEKYGDNLVYEDDYVRKSGKFWDLQYALSLAIIYFHFDLKRIYHTIKDDFSNIGDLRKYSKEVQKEVDKEIMKYQKEKISWKDGYLFEINYDKFRVGSLVANILSNNEKNKTFIILREGKRYYHVSVRRQDNGIDTGKFLSKLLDGLEEAAGGGHAEAAGGHFMKKDISEFKKRLGL